MKETKPCFRVRARPVGIDHEQSNIDALDECEMLVLFKGLNKDSAKCVAWDV